MIKIYPENRIIDTERLILKPFTLDDAQGLYDYAKNPDVGPRAGWKPHESVEESAEIIKTIFFKGISWVIRLNSEDRQIGSIALEFDRLREDANSKEMGYSLAKDMWGKGIMTEAGRAVMEYGFSVLKLSQIGICTSPTNLRSQGVIKKLGFIYEGTLRRTMKTFDGVNRDSMVFSITADEFEAFKIK